MIKNMPKKIKRSIENNSSRNGCTVTSNDTFQVFHIPTNKVTKYGGGDGTSKL